MRTKKFPDPHVLGDLKAFVDEQCEGNVKAAARELNVSYETLRSWLQGTRSPTLESLMPVWETLQTIKSATPNDAALQRNVDVDSALLEEFAFVPLVAAVAGAGESFSTDDSVCGVYAFKKSFLQKICVDPRHSCLMHVLGDSMQPLICEGDIILIDKRDQRLVDGRIYVLTLGHALMVKRVHLIAHGWQLCSENAERYYPESVVGQELDKLVVHGRVRWFGRVL